MNSDELAQKLSEELGPDLISVVLYGSAVTGDRTKRLSDENLLVIVKNADVGTLDAIASVLRQWRKAPARDNSGGKPTPVIFSEEQFRNSADVFPIEFLDMAPSHRVLLGQDPFREVKLDPHNLSHQLEYELRSKILHLRQRYLEMGDDVQELSRLLGKSLSSFSALFRAVLRLIGETPPVSRREMWESLNRHVPIDLGTLDAVLALREGSPSMNKEEIKTLFSKYFKILQDVTDFVDKIHQSKE